MNTLYLVPAKDIDPAANAIAVTRGVDGDFTLAPDLKGQEAKSLDGRWPGHQFYFGKMLPAVRMNLTENFLPKVSRVHADLGNEVSTLYAAYYAIAQGAPTLVTVHRPYLGGESFWAESHPLVVRRLALIVLARTETVFVPSVEVAKALYARYPAIRRDYVGAPLSGLRCHTRDLPGLDDFYNAASGEQPAAIAQ